MSGSRGHTPAPAAPSRWLAIGNGTAEALRAHLERQGAESGLEDADIVQVRDVHDALHLLHDGPVTVCVVSADVIEDRPGAALRVLQEQLGAAPLLLLDGDEAPDARDVAKEMGVPLWTGTREDHAPVTPPTTKKKTTRAPLPPSTSKNRVPETNDVPPLPRADADTPDAQIADGGEFAAGCLKHQKKLKKLVHYVVSTMTEVSNATRVSLMLVEPKGRQLKLFAGHGIHEALLGSVRCTMGSGIAGRVAALGRMAAGHGSTGGARGYPGSAYVVLPLGRGEACQGVINLTGLPGNTLPDKDVLRSWSEIGIHAGNALATSRELRRAKSASTTDELTGLPNRRAFESALKRELERARRAGSGLAVGVCDVDKFKTFNDHYGHLIGDQVLKEVARRLEGAFRETDLVARWGGEEFAVLLPCPTPEEAANAHTVLDRARVAVGSRPFALGEGLAPTTVTISGGLAVFPDVDGPGAALVEAADERLFLAKEQGRNRIVWA